MNIKPIKSEEDYKNALKQVEELWDAKFNSAEGDILSILLILIDDYEDKHYKIFPPDPIEAIKFRMEQLGLRNKDIAKILGGANRVSEILNRKRDLTVKMIRSLNKNLGIPAESLIGQN